MFRKILCLGVLCLMAMPALAEDLAGGPVDKKVGYSLLDAITVQFQDMAISGSGGYPKVDQFLRTALVNAKKAKEQKQIDLIFYARFARLLAMMDLFMLPDREGILRPVIDREIRDFVKDVLGEEWRSEEGIGKVAYAFGDEIINLQMYLDNLEVKEKLWKSFEGKYAPQPEKRGAIKKDS
jgi:hypothetical protein